MNLELLNVIYPKDIKHLIEELDEIEPFAFAFNLQGLKTTRQSQKFDQEEGKRGK